MTEPNPYDIIILGGGCAGLSLAMRLAQAGQGCPSVLILEQRAAYTNDRTWCFWDNGAADFGALATHRWKKLSVGDVQSTVDIHSDFFSYAHLPADQFYDHALQIIKKNEAIELALGKQVIAVAPVENQYWRIKTQEATYKGKIIIDTRPHYTDMQQNAILWQSFLGYEITCTEPVFEPDRAVLMDFLPPNTDDIRFNYVLPFTRHKALIEATAFGAAPLTQIQLGGLIDSALRKYAKNSRFEIGRVEYGILPMGLTHDAKNIPGFVRAGLTAGGARNSSGYAFQRIQKWAALCARNILAKGTAIPHPPDSVMQRIMDYLFLMVLKDRPHDAASLFISLFKKADTNALIRFLDDRASLNDYLKIITALPAKVFLNQIMTLMKQKILSCVRAK